MDERINKIIVFYDYEKSVPVLALINYTQRSHGQSQDFTITERNEEGIKYYEEVCARQNNCKRNQLVKIGKKEVHDIKEYNPLKDYFNKYDVPKFDVPSLNTSIKKNVKTESEKDRKRKKIIIITSVATATIIAVLSTGFVLSEFFDIKKKAYKVLTKIEQQGNTPILNSEIKDLVQYIETENDDNIYQREERDLNDRVLNGLIQNEYQQYVINKAQGLFKNCFDDNNPRKNLNKTDVYRYFMYMASLFKEGDIINGMFDGTIAFQMKDTYQKGDDYSSDAVKFTNNGQISLNRIMYAARRDEANTFKKMPLIMKKILMEQFLTVCKNSNIKYELNDQPSWWADKSHYSVEKLYQEIEEMCREISDNLAIERENSMISSKKH